MVNKANVPEGEDFLHLVWVQEDACEDQTDKRLPDLGKKAPACLGHLGTMLSYLDRMASCWWACRNGDHRIEYLCGRAASNARAILRLVRFGFYDEALLLCRGLGEVANLMQLFVSDSEALQEWKTSSPSQIRKKFSPVKVRIRIEGTSSSAVISQERYRLLSERVAHVHPSTTPQAHNFLGMPFAGSELQEAGILVCLNELAIPVCFIATFGTTLLELSKMTAKRIVLSARTLAEQIGEATFVNIDDYYHNARMHPIVGENAAIAERLLRKFQRHKNRL